MRAGLRAGRSAEVTRAPAVAGALLALLLLVAGDPAYGLGAAVGSVLGAENSAGLSPTVTLRSVSLPSRETVMVTTSAHLLAANLEDQVVHRADGCAVDRNDHVVDLHAGLLGT